VITSHPIGSGRSLFPENERHTFLENAIKRGSTMMDRSDKLRTARSCSYGLAELLTEVETLRGLCEFERQQNKIGEAEAELERIAAFMGFTITRQSEQRSAA